MTDEPADPARRAVLGLLAAGAAGLVGWRLLPTAGVVGEAGPTPTATEPLTTTSSTTTTDAPTTTVPESSTTTDAPTTTVPESSTTTDAPTTTTQPASTTTGPTDGVVVVTVVSKGSWGAAPAQSGFVTHRVDRLMLHHTASALTDDARAAAKWRGTQAYHQDQGWPDVAYHFGVDLSGRAYEGRPLEYRGDTFTEYDPTGHFLVCCMGDYNASSPPAAMVETAARLFAWAAVRFGVGSSGLSGHRDYAATTCPGANLYDRLPAIGKRIDELVAAGGVTLDWV